MDSSFRGATGKAFYKQDYCVNVVFKRTVESNDKIGQSDLHKVAALNHFTKGAMISPFLGAPCTKPTFNTTKEIQSLMELPKVLLKFVCETFQK